MDRMRVALLDEVLTSGFAAQVHWIEEPTGPREGYARKTAELRVRRSLFRGGPIKRNEFGLPLDPADR